MFCQVDVFHHKQTAVKGLKVMYKTLTTLKGLGEHIGLRLALKMSTGHCRNI